ncbi:DNA-binding protein [Paraburkholderia sediminicola]|uniref:DNA-binding protein n=1 Tax=Paraburkholderia sediminicola TaxID=458836 RepID=UPI0038BD8CAA
MQAQAAQLIPQGLAAVAKGRDTISTVEAAHAINRKPQTLRKWASQENGPVKPVRINGRLDWRVIDLARLLNVGG